MTITELEKKLKTQLPNDYKNFIAPYNNDAFKYHHNMESWDFLSPDQMLAETLQLRTLGHVGPEDVVFALNYDDGEREAGDAPCAIFYRKIGDSLSNVIFHLGLMRDQMFLAFSISEFEKWEVMFLLKRSIEEVGFENQNLDVLKDCPGSLYWYAHQLELMAYEDETTLKRHDKAMEIFLATAALGHPHSANALANHYYFKADPVDIDQVLMWMEKSIIYDSHEYKYKMADFIIDYKPTDIDRAINLLESILDTHWYKGRAALKLSRIYMRGIGGKLDLTKALHYASICAEDGNYNGFSDLGFMYYKGKGVDKDVQKAYEYMVKANNLSKGDDDEGMFEKIVEQLKNELGL